MSLHSPHDLEVLDTPTPLRLLLALLRIAAGARGHAGVTWHAAGFTYQLTAVREPGEDLDYEIDDDPSARHLPELLDKLAAAIEP